MNINLEQLGSLVTDSVSQSLITLTKILQDDTVENTEKVKVAEQIRKINDDIARWDVVSGAIAGDQDDRKRLINKLDNLK